ncbi:lipoyl(octanoyl) transferase LipB [Gilliamella sp. ESL0405]|uniref:lipoyl(octanoyl) transferase LipB n=1 Tax=Gilliamella sp. ESL0405 TaxID=2704653 RepID=UPI001C69C7D5|nr:lipoyl(octanoyl) transferase LipB [Gilliamella sp. ESL0405]QYN46518.1 lipoyl(octanoyl) transferase LipB [Gilliamella sp. ESL0405]
MIVDNIIIKDLGITPYMTAYHAMHEFTVNRDANTPDQIWFVEHPPVFTQGKVGKAEHLLVQSEIPVIQTDRGGQITYHAPGQQIMYVLFDLKRAKIGIRDMVSYLENSVIQTLAHYDIIAYAKSDAPGVYIDDKKICSLGLHIKQGCTLHGLALNVDMDLKPFNNINPCGYAGLQMTQLKQFKSQIDRNLIRKLLADNFLSQLLNK